MTAAVGQDPGGLVGEGVSGDEAGVWVSVALTPGGRLRSEKMAGNEGGRGTPSKGMPWTPWSSVGLGPRLAGKWETGECSSCSQKPGHGGKESRQWCEGRHDSQKVLWDTAVYRLF